MKKYPTNEVFTPSSSAKLTFVERDDINNSLVDSLKTIGKQIIVYGYSGVGKTTLLRNKLEQVYERTITSSCFKGRTVDQLIMEAFDHLDIYYIADKESKKTHKIGGSLEASYSKIKATLQAEISGELVEKSKRIVVVGLTPQRLAQFLGTFKCCWVIEDAHKLENAEKEKLSQMMKIFVDVAGESNDYKELKMIVIGATGTGREIVEYDSNMRNRVAEILVPTMDETELLEIIKKGESLLNISFDNEVKNIITKLSNGLPSICHQLCLNMCFEHGIYETIDNTVHFKKEDLDNAVNKYMREYSDTFKATYDKITKVHRGGKLPNGKLIIEAFIRCNSEYISHNELLKEIQKKEINYRSSNLTTYLKKLCSEDMGEYLKQDEASGKYFFTNLLDKAYAMMIYRKENKNIDDTIEFNFNGIIMYNLFYKKSVDILSL